MQRFLLWVINGNVGGNEWNVDGTVTIQSHRRTIQLQGRIYF